MADGIRPRVWLVGVIPLVVVVGVVAVLVTTSRGKPTRVIADDPAETPLPVMAPAQLPPPVATIDPSPVAMPMPASHVSPAAASSVRGPPPEPLPELDEFLRPPGSAEWTLEQKLAYRQKAFADVATRERSLEREVAAARQAGDAKTEQEKTATLAYLRGRRADIERAMSAQEAQQAQRAQRDGGT
jgi:hypothetical protein